MAKPTESTEWAGHVDALVTATDSARWNYGWTTPSNDPSGIGEKPNLNQQNYWQNAVHKWLEHMREPAPLVPLDSVKSVGQLSMAVSTWVETMISTIDIDVVAGQSYVIFLSAPMFFSMTAASGPATAYTETRLVLDSTPVPAKSLKTICHIEKTAGFDYVNTCQCIEIKLTALTTRSINISQEFYIGLLENPASYNLQGVDGSNTEGYPCGRIEAYDYLDAAIGAYEMGALRRWYSSARGGSTATDFTGPSAHVYYEMDY